MFAIIWRQFRLNKKAAQCSVAAVITLFGIYSVASVHDCMDSYRARYKAIEDLEASGIDPKRIDGGWEYDMMSRPDLIKTLHAIPGGWKIKDSDRGTPPLNKVRWWSCASDEYVISQKEYDGYEVVKRYPYRMWVWNCRKEMLSLKKITGSAATPK